MSKNIDIWLVIDSYFKTIKRNLVSHQLDSYNMFILQQIPKTVRQFNPIVLLYSDNNRIEITIGGSKKGESDIISNDSKGIYISKPAIYEKKKIYYKRE